MAAEPWALDDDELAFYAALARAARPALSGRLAEARPAWHAHAACRDAGIDFFDPAQIDAARTVCAGCAVADACRAAGAAEPFGMWGGDWRWLRRGKVVR